MVRKTLIIIIAFMAAACTKMANTKVATKELGHMNYSWMSDYDSTTRNLSYEANWVGGGWWYGDDVGKGKSANLSSYEQIVIEIDSIDPSIKKMGLSIEYTNNQTTWLQVPVVNGKAVLRSTLNPEYKNKVREIYLLSCQPGKAHLKSAYMRSHIQYAEPHQLKITDGVIDKKQLEGFSKNARLDFTYSTSGELTQTDDKGKTISIHNWAVGFIISAVDTNEETAPGRSIHITKTGLQTYSCYLDDLQHMLAVTDSATGLCGLKFVVWPLGNLKDVHIVSATISEVKE